MPRYPALYQINTRVRLSELSHALGRAATLDDFSDYIVGTTLFIDGGMTLYPGFETGG